MAEPETLDLSEHDDAWRVLDGILSLAVRNKTPFQKERAARQHLLVVRSQKAARLKAQSLVAKSNGLTDRLTSAAAQLVAFRADPTQNTDNAKRLRREKRFDKTVVALRANLLDVRLQLQAAGLSEDAKHAEKAWQSAMAADDRNLASKTERDRLKSNVGIALDAIEPRLKILVDKDDPARRSSPLAKAEKRLKDSLQAERQNHRWLADSVKQLKALKAMSANNGVSRSEDMRKKQKKLRDAETTLQQASDALASFRPTGDPAADAAPVQAMNRAETRLKRAQKAHDLAVAADGVYRSNLSQAITTAQLLSPNGSELARLLRDTHDELRLAHLERSMGDISSQIRENLSGLDEAGSSVTTSITASIGVTFGDRFKSINKDSTVADAGVKLTARVELTIERGAGGSFIASFTHAESVGGNATVGPARLTAALGVKFGEKRTYGSIEELIQNESVIVKLTPGFLDKKANEGKSVDLLREVKDLRNDTAARRALYQDRLRKINALDDGQSLKKPMPYEVDVTTTRSRALNAAVGATLVQGWKRPDWDPDLEDDDRVDRLGVSGSLDASVERERITQHRRVGFFDEVRKNHVLQEIATRSTPDVFGFEITDSDGFVKYLKGDMANEHLRAMSNRLQSVNADIAKGAQPNSGAELRAERDAIATQLESSMNALEREYDGFITVANKIDTKQISGSSATRDQLRRNLGQRGLNQHDDRHFVNTLNRRALKPADAAQYVRAMSLQLSALARTYQSAFPDGTPPPSGRDLIEGFGDKLRTPTLAISIKDLAKHLSFNAKTEPVTVTTIAAKLSGSFAVAPPTNRGADGEGFVTRANVNASVGIQYASEKAVGASTSKSLTMTIGLGGGFSIGALVLDDEASDGGGNVASILPQRVRDKLKDLMQRNGDDPVDVAALDHQIRDAIKALANPTDPSKEVSFSFSKKAGGWQLQTAETIARRGRGFNVGLSVPTPVPGLNVAGSIGASQSRVFVKQRYYAPTTLSTLSSAFRELQSDTQGDTEQKWNAFKEDTQLFSRDAAAIDALVIASGADFVRVTSAIHDDDIEALRNEKRRLERQGASAAGLLNDMESWLIDMALSDDADAKAAAKQYEAAFSMATNNQRTRDARMASVAKAMESLVRSKVKQEDKDSSFHTVHEVSREDIQDYAFSLIDAQRKTLARSLGALESDDLSIGQIQSRAALLFKKARLGEADGMSAEKAAKMLGQALALEYAGETIVDLTEFNNDEDKNRALIKLMDELPRTLAGDGPNVHMGEYMTGELVYDSESIDGLRVVRRVREEHQTKVTRNDIWRTEKDTARRLKKLELKAPLEKVTYRDSSNRDREYDPDKADLKSRKIHYKAIEAKAKRVTSNSKAYDIKHRVKKGYARHKPSENFDALFRKWMKKKRESDERKDAARLTRRRRKAKEAS